LLPGARRAYLCALEELLSIGPQGGTAHDLEGRHDDRVPLTIQKFATLLERFASAQTVTDVNIAAGIALNELLGIDD
jgi:hypothetical protein